MVKLIKNGFFKTKIYKFDNAFLPDKLSDIDIHGEDTKTKRFILVYKNEEEKIFYMNKLGIDGKKTIYSIKDFING